jgi:flagellar biosynthesis GTPase FlhF
MRGLTAAVALPMSGSDMDSDVKTFRGRTLEELLPQIKQELGPDAIVLRRREGLGGGVAGFFQRSFVEVEARRPLPGESELETRNDRATAEGLRAPAIQALVEQAAPFADALARVDDTASDRASDVLLATAAQGAVTAPAPAPAGLYGPQPNVVPDPAPAPAAPSVDEDLAAVVARREPPRYDAHSPAPLPVAPAAAAPPEVLVAPPVVANRPAAADAAERRLADGGLSAGLAADVVGEAVTHGLPFVQPRAFKKLVRGALARRVPVMSDLGPDRRVIAVAGAGGAGKTALISRLAAAYAAADHEVVVVALNSRDGGCDVAEALEPLGVSVIAATDAKQAARRLRHREPLITLVDTPALGAGDARAAAALAPELRALGCTEVHLALPATVSAAAADEIAAALAPLGLTHLALTHSDQTARPGAPVELAIRTRRPLSYVATRDEVAPADAATIASGLLP